MTTQDGIGLSEALEKLREELAAARELAADSSVQFPIESLTVELKVGIARSADGTVGFKVPFLGVQLGGSGGHASESMQTVTLVLGPPVDQNGRPIKVAAEAEKQKS